MRAFFLLLLLGSVSAADLTPAESKELRALYQDAVSAGDIWTGIQIEASSKIKGSAQRGILGASKVYGQPLFAFPTWISTVFDGGSQIGVVTHNHYHLIADDGRPLALSTRLAPNLACAALSFSRDHLATLHGLDQPDDEHRAFLLHSQIVPNGDVGIKVRLTFEAEDNITGEICVSDDGGALAFGMHREGQRAVVVVRGRNHRVIPGFGEPLAISNGATWLIAREGDSPRKPVLIVGDESTITEAAAAGPGIAAIIHEGKAQIVDAQGKRRALVLPFALGKDPSLNTVGRWLVVGSGFGAQEAEVLDALGNPVATTQRSHQVCFFRWSDLGDAKSKTEPEVVDGAMSVDRCESASIYLWNDAQIDVVDLSGEKPERRALATMPASIDWVDDLRSRTRVNMRDTWAYLDRLGRILWQGKANWSDLADADFAVAHIGNDEDSRTYHLGVLAVDAKDRRTLELNLDPGRWSIEVDNFTKRCFVSRGPRWAEIDTDNGKIGDFHRRREMEKPDVRQIWDGPGRFRHVFGRLFDKTSGENVPMAQRLHPIDAWMLGGNMIVLGQERSVAITVKKPGEFIGLGHVPQAAQLMASDASPVVAVDGNDVAWAMLVKGPKLDFAVPVDIKVKPFLGGRWRVDYRSFAAPGTGGNLVWDADSAGFDPIRLRCPEESNMLVITMSLVIELDPAAVKLVGMKP
jgi:hypothetical protein